MPIFEYRCPACGATFEELVFGDKAPPCPSCGGKDTEKLMSCCRHTSGGGGEHAPASGGGGRSGCAGCSGGSCATCK